MTKEEFTEKIKSISQQIDDLADQREKLKAAFVAAAPFKYGDKVLINGKTECFVGNVRITWTNQYDYDFRKVKKDGTMSQHSAGFFGGSYRLDIEKIG